MIALLGAYLPTLMAILATIAAAVSAKYIFGLLASYLILPAQVLVEKHRARDPDRETAKYDLKYFDVSAPGMTLDTIEITPKKVSSNPNAITDHPYIIQFCPNAMSYHQKVDEKIDIALSCNATVIGFDYPNVGQSTGSVYSSAKLVDAGIAQVQRLLDRGVAPENIKLHGLSLGGAVATLVAAHFHQQNPPKRVYLINDRSFSSISRTVGGMFGVPALRFLLKPLLYLLTWDLDVVKAYQSIPEQYKIIIVAKDDSIIKYETASLATQFPNTNDHVIEIKNGHNLPFVHCDDLQLLTSEKQSPILGRYALFVNQPNASVGSSPKNNETHKADASLRQ